MQMLSEGVNSKHWESSLSRTAPRMFRQLRSTWTPWSQQHGVVCGHTGAWQERWYHSKYQKSFLNRGVFHKYESVWARCLLKYTPRLQSIRTPSFRKKAVFKIMLVQCMVSSGIREGRFLTRIFGGSRTSSTGLFLSIAMDMFHFNNDKL